jgi:hypothetical protein
MNRSLPCVPSRIRVCWMHLLILAALLARTQSAKGAEITGTYYKPDAKTPASGYTYWAYDDIGPSGGPKTTDPNGGFAVNIDKFTTRVTVRFEGPNCTDHSGPYEAGKDHLGQDVTARSNCTSAEAKEFLEFLRTAKKWKRVPPLSVQTIIRDEGTRIKEFKDIDDILKPEQLDNLKEDLHYLKAQWDK